MKAIFITLCAFISLSASAFACDPNNTIDSRGPSVYPTPDGDSYYSDQTDTTITIDGVAIKEADFVKEYITQYEYNPKSKKFIVHKCNQEKAAALVKKDHNHKRDGHGGMQVHGRRDRERRTRYCQWYRCDACLRAFQGPESIYDHVQDTGHRMFHRI